MTVTSKLFPELDMEAGIKFMIFNDVSRQVSCGLLMNLFTVTQPSANLPANTTSGLELKQ